MTLHHSDNYMKLLLLSGWPALLLGEDRGRRGLSGGEDPELSAQSCPSVWSPQTTEEPTLQDSLSQAPVLSLRLHTETPGLAGQVRYPRSPARPQVGL